MLPVKPGIINNNISFLLLLLSIQSIDNPASSTISLDDVCFYFGCLYVAIYL